MMARQLASGITGSRRTITGATSAPLASRSGLSFAVGRTVEVRSAKEMCAMVRLSSVKGIAQRDQRMIEAFEGLFAAEPPVLGCVKSLFWGRVRDDLLLPYPAVNDDEARRCDE